MQKIILVIVLLVTICSGCSDEDKLVEVEEIISVPNTPDGSDNAYVNVGEIFTSGGSISSEGHSVEYRFDFDTDGDHDITVWSGDTTATKTWTEIGTYSVKSQARCSTHTDKVSAWSDAKVVTVVMPLSTPNVSGTTSVEAGAFEASYYVGGSINSDGGLIEYRLDFDADNGGDYSAWEEEDPMIDDRARFRKTWPNPGTYIVKGQARSAEHPERMSSWSDGLTVIVVPATSAAESKD